MFAGLHNFSFPFISKLAEKFGEENITLLTYGDKEFQELKINSSGLISLFNNVVYTEEDKEEYIRKCCILNGRSKVVFIDDTFRHFILHNVPTNLSQICVNATGKLTEAQIDAFHKAGILVEENRNKIVGHLKKLEGSENKSPR